MKLLLFCFATNTYFYCFLYRRNLKFDLRLYVLLMGVNPLRVFLFKDGLVRLATEPYVKPKEDNIDNLFMHLTNYAINKKNNNF